MDETIQADDTGGLRLATDEGTTRLYSKDDGKVGVGTTDPQSLLSVGGSGQSYASVFVQSSLTNGVRSEISSRDGSAIVGIASSTYDSENYGGYFVAHGGYGRGADGYTSGVGGKGILGEAAGSFGTAVVGKASDSGDCTNYGGYFEAAGRLQPEDYARNCCKSVAIAHLNSNQKRQALVTACPSKSYQMGRGGFEPPTHGFSVRCSTN